MLSNDLGFSPPHSHGQLNAIEAPNRLDTPNHSTHAKVVRYAPGIVVKYGAWEQLYAEEVLCMRFAEQLGLPVPRVLYHPGKAEERVPFSIDLVIARMTDYADTVWCICMEEMRGVTLEDALDYMSDRQLAHVGRQLKQIVARIGKRRSSYIGSITGDPFRSLLVPLDAQPDRTFSTTSDFMEYYRPLLIQVLHSTSRADEVLAPFLDEDEAEQADGFCFAHGDLLPKNIMVDPENGYTITAILDWENAGFYPPRWDYYRMHDPMHMTPQWSRVLDIVFDHKPRDDTKIKALGDFLVAINCFV